MARHSNSANDHGKHSEAHTGNRAALRAWSCWSGQHRTEEDQGSLPSGTPLTDGTSR
jgi:hypothetical protein